LQSGDHPAKFDKYSKYERRKILSSLPQCRQLWQNLDENLNHFFARKKNSSGKKKIVTKYAFSKTFFTKW